MYPDQGQGPYPKVVCTRRLCSDYLQQGGCSQDHPIIAGVSISGWLAGVALPVGRAAGLG
eukprot:3470345-Rhodomonas_salina.1